MLYRKRLKAHKRNHDLISSCRITTCCLLLAMFSQPICGQSQPAAAQKPPNFVIILADDMGYGDAGCYGGWLDTPHLDRLAAQGLRFTDFHSNGVVCSPTRASLLTGRYPHRAGITGVINADPKHPTHHLGLNPAEVTFSKLLQSAGYATAIFGKWHLGYQRRFNPTQFGFDQFRGFISGNIDYHSHLDRMGTFDWWIGARQADEQGYSTHLITNHATDFIRKNRERPFCVYVAHEAIHSPWQAPDDPPVRTTGTDKPPLKTRSTKQTIRLMMNAMDGGIGEIVDALTECGIEQHTLVFFFSDNGPAGGSAGQLRGKKGSLLEGGHRVPAVAWWPGQIKPGKTAQTAMSFDVMPTILDLAQVSLPEDCTLDGISLKSLLREGIALKPRRLFWSSGSHFAVRDGRWKAVFDGSPKLFDLQTDLSETTNLAGKIPQRLQSMKSHLENWKEDVAAK